jgi:AraC-like DNA-binding protein
MTFDPLSDVLSLIEAKCVVSGSFQAGKVWALDFQPRFPLKLTAVVTGSLLLCVDDDADGVPLRAGDVAVLNDCTRVVLASGPGVQAMSPVETSAVFDRNRQGMVELNDGADVVTVGGHVEVNPVGRDMLRAALPKVTIVRAGDGEGSALHWLVRSIAREMATGGPGTDIAVRQTAQLLLIEVLRLHLVDWSTLPPGWLRVMADDRLAPAVRSLHAHPERSWHLDDLAAEAKMSRTAFATRFTAVAGRPPLRYLHDWRMLLAEKSLRADATTMGEIARSIGYSSDSAFSNAFARRTGTSPKRFRDEARKASSEG